MAWRGKAWLGGARQANKKPGELMQNPDVIQRLKELQTEIGGLTADKVITDAEDESSPLHKYFEWDDSIAANEHRREQARSLIRSVRLEVKSEKTTIKVVGYVKDPDTDHGEQGYIATSYLLNDIDKARRVLTQELSRAESSMVRAQEVAASVGLSKEIGKLLAQLRGIRSAA